MAKYNAKGIKKLDYVAKALNYTWLCYKLTWLIRVVSFSLFLMTLKVRTFNYRFEIIRDAMKETSSSTTTASISGDSTSTEAGSTADVSSVPAEAVQEQTSMETTMMPMEVDAEIVECESSRSYMPLMTSTPKPKKCKKCPKKAKKIKDLKRKNQRLGKRLKSLEEKYIQLKNSQVQFLTV